MSTAGCILAVLCFVGWLLCACRLSAVRERLDDARHDRDVAYDRRDDMEADLQAARAKATHLADLVRATVLVADVGEDDACLMELAADLDPEVHGLAAVLGANDPRENR